MKVLTGNKNLKFVVANFGKKTLSKQLAAGETRKGRIRRRLLPKRSRQGDFKNFCVEILEKKTVLEPIDSFHLQEVYHSLSLLESSIEFEFETDRSIHLDVRDIHLQIKVALQKGRSFDEFKR